jgi:PPOX class probable F420-dependent enzyme
VFRRPEIAMSPEELRAFLDEERTVTCASIGPDGRPHLMPLWYVREGDEILCWTYGNSQKVKNLERLPQATLQVEAGEKYDELRGAMLECDVEIVRDRERIVDIGVALTYRYGSVPPGTPDESIRARAAQRGSKRVGLRFRPTRIVSWDHRKLGGSY